MASKLKEGEQVFVPRALINASLDAISAYYRTKVAAIKGGGVVTISYPNGTFRDVHARHLVRGNGVALILIEDGQSTKLLLDPLHDSIFNYLKLLLPDDSIKLVRVDSLKSLAQSWSSIQDDVGIVVFIAHGIETGEGIYFAVGGLVKAPALLGILGNPKDSKYFLSLACYSGKQPFGEEFSKNRKICKGLFAPSTEVHGAIASHYCQTFISYMILNGNGGVEAWRNSIRALPDNTNFKMWSRGNLVPSPQK